MYDPNWRDVARERDADADAELIPRCPGRVRFIPPMPSAQAIFERTALPLLEQRALVALAKLRAARRAAAS